MKKLITSLLAGFITCFSFAQDVKLNDSVIFINDKPVALYATFPSPAPAHFNMEVYSFDDYVLIKAEVIKFSAPVAELKPFYYYELTFPPAADTFAVYIEDGSIPIVVAHAIRDYDLIQKNELNKENVTRFIAQFYGGAALTEKIKSVEDYLDTTRQFHMQVERDRTRPVNIINNNIMQDGHIIGKLSYLSDNNISYSSRATNTNNQVLYKDQSTTRVDANNPLKYYPQRRSGSVINFRADGNSGAANSFNYPQNTTSTQRIICYINGRHLIFDKKYNNWKNQYEINSKKIPLLNADRNLYQVSKAEFKNIDPNTNQLLLRICSLIEDYRL